MHPFRRYHVVFNEVEAALQNQATHNPNFASFVLALLGDSQVPVAGCTPLGQADEVKEMKHD